MFDHPIFRFGLPPDRIAFGALGLALLALIWHVRPPARRLFQARPTLWVALLALSAALLSLGYTHYYLKGGPRIIDAAAYRLAAKTLLTPAFSFTPPEPNSLFFSRFLVHVPGEDTRLGVLFPPGYPLLLALFESARRPEASGPCLALLLTVGVYHLAHNLASLEKSIDDNTPRAAGLLAALLSTFSATQRYHTAETMSHGWGALLVLGIALLTVALWAPNAPRRLTFYPFALGLLLGALTATRPLTALTLGFGFYMLLRGRLPARAFPLVALGMAPGLFLLAAQQRALTGSYFSSAQLLYYAQSDGPPGCFGLGLGKGCVVEHGDVISERGPLGPLWMILNTFHRLHQHSLDLANFEPLAILLLVLLVNNRSRLSSRLVLWPFSFLALGYSTFYFDGSYPGGGARFFSEMLPLEHAALGLHGILTLRKLPLVALSLAGFAVHGSFSHRALAERDGGAPFLDAHVLGANPQVLFVRSDHAFLHGFDPRALPPPGAPLRAPLVARKSFDQREQALLDQLGSPAAFELTYEPPGRELRPWVPPSPPPGWLEAERNWPPLGVVGGWAHPMFGLGACFSRNAGLGFERLQTSGVAPQVRVPLEGVLPGSYRLRARWGPPAGPCFETVAGPFSAPGSALLPLPNPAPTHPEWPGLVLDGYLLEPLEPAP